MISVVIPTANRPKLLRQALRSVSAQTARDRISTVIVSENGGNEESRQICAEFPELPIHYVYRDPATSASEHGRILVSEGFRDKYTAMLCDDDWWMPHHLANGLQELENRRGAVAYFSSFYEVSDEAGLMASDSHHFCWWFGANFPQLELTWELSLPEVAAACFLATPGHYSSLIAHSKILEEAFRIVFELDNPYDNDRMVAVALATLGAVLYHPLANLFVRFHATQDTHNHLAEVATQYSTQTTNWILATCEMRGIDLQSVVAERIIKCPPEARARLNSFFNSSRCVPLGRKIAVLFPETADFVPDAWRSMSFRKMKNILRQLLPPIAIRVIRFNRAKKLFKPLSPKKS